jgi:Glycosyltransferase family 87
MPRRLQSLLPLLWIALWGYYLYRTGVQVWPFLFQSEGDFGSYHAAAMAVARGESPYLPKYIYPPVLAVVLAPLAALPLATARVIWYLVSQACLLGSAGLLVRRLGGGPAAVGSVTLVWCLAGTVPENLGLGQVNPLLLLLLTAGPAAIGLAAALKIWPGLLLVDSVLARRWREVAWGLGSAAFFLLAPWIFVRWTTTPPYAPLHRTFWMGSPAPLNVSLPATVLRATYPLDAPELPADWAKGTDPGALRLNPERRWLSVGAALVTLAAGLLLACRMRQRRWRIAALTSLALVASPLSWYHYQLLQFPALAALGLTLWRRRAWTALAGLAAVAVGMTHTDVLRRLAELWSSTPTATFFWAGVMAVLSQVAFLSWLVCEDRRREALREDRE